MESQIKKFKIFSIKGSEQLSVEAIGQLNQVILSISKNSEWWNDSADQWRYSLTNCKLFSDGVLAGLISQQYPLEQNLYTDKKENEKKQLDSYEDRLFFLNLAEGIITLEWTKFIKKPGLTPGTMMTRLVGILNDALKRINLDTKLFLEPYKRETSKQEFVDIFYNPSYRIKYISIEKFGLEAIPSDVTLVNPNKDLEGAARDLILHDIRHPSLDKLTAEAKKDNFSDLKKSAFVRGALHSGEPNFIRFQQDSSVKIRKKNENGEISIEIPVPENYSMEDMIKISEKVIPRINEIDRNNLPPREIEKKEPSSQLILDLGDKADGK